jgi:serine/threonine protein kinase
VSVPPDIPPDLRAALVERFELRCELGRGGMATVYLAWDQKHHREVALKVFRPDLAASIGTERFLHEIQIAARLTHPHILALHDSGEAGGYLFYVMPYIEGRSLRQHLERAGPLDLAEIVSIVAPVAGALSYAHRMGVFHRDIKPENILFAQGHPIVADFGIAKAISTAGGANLTRTGFPLGTPGYMSPEQALGLTDLDGRTDVYSLAVVTYEMLVGATPRGWPTEEAVRTGRFLDASADHRLRLNGAGSRVEGALVRALSVRLDQRTPTPDRFIEELTGAAAPRRRFNEQEVRDIVRIAAEAEAGQPTMSGALTIGGIEALGSEVGLAPETIRSAAESLGMQAVAPVSSSGRLNQWLGGPTGCAYEQVIEGELPESEFPVLVAEIRRVMRNVGQVSQLGPSFSWSSAPGSSRRDLEVAVLVRGGRTRILIQENYANLIGGVFGGIGGGMGGGGMGPVIGVTIQALSAPPILLLGVIPLWLLGTYATARGVYRAVTRRRERTLRELGDRLVALARQLVPARPALKRWSKAE